MNIIKKHPGHDVLIGLDTIGKEDLLAEVAAALNTKISVSQERMKLIEATDDLPKGLFTTLGRRSYIKATTKAEITEQR